MTCIKKNKSLGLANKNIHYLNINKNLFYWGNPKLSNFLPLIIHHHYNLIIGQKSMKDGACERNG